MNIFFMNQMLTELTRTSTRLTSKTIMTVTAYG